MGRPLLLATRGPLTAVVVAALLVAACGMGGNAEPEGSDASSPRSKTTLVDLTGDEDVHLSTSSDGASGQRAAAGTSSGVAASGAKATTASGRQGSGGGSATAPPPRGAPGTTAPAGGSGDARPTALPGQIAVANHQGVDVWSEGTWTTVSKRYEDTPRWSPDGTKLAYLDSRDRVVVISYPDLNFVGSVTVSGQVVEYRWSPDNDHIALTAPAVDCALVYCYPKRDAGIWVASITKGTLRQIAVGAHGPTWDPTGRHLAYVVGRDVHIATSSGEDSRLLYRPTSRSVSHLEWGPGPWIAAISSTTDAVSAGSHSQLALLPVRDGEITAADLIVWDEVLEGGGNIAWAPNGRSLAVASRTGPYVTAGVGQPLVRVGEDGVTSSVTWSPDGRWLAYDDGDVTEVASLTGRGVVYLGPGAQPHWRPT